MAESSYENLRLQRIEENKKRLQLLNLNQLAIDLKNSGKQSKPRAWVKKKYDPAQIRRSGRLSGKPVPKQEGIVFEYELQRRTTGIARETATRTAEELSMELTRDEGFPCFVKPMRPSYVRNEPCCSLILPTVFCMKHLPECDETITLLNQLGEEFGIQYIAQKHGLTSGWMEFRKAHDLIDGDSLVFQLMEPTKFKIHIIRANQMILRTR